MQNKKHSNSSTKIPRKQTLADYKKLWNNNSYGKVVKQEKSNRKLYENEVKSIENRIALIKNEEERMNKKAVKTQNQVNLLIYVQGLRKERIKIVKFFILKNIFNNI